MKNKLIKLILAVLTMIFLWRELLLAAPDELYCCLRPLSMVEKTESFGAPRPGIIETMREFIGLLQECTDFLHTVENKTFSSLDENDFNAFEEYVNRFERMHQRAIMVVGRINRFVSLAERVRYLLLSSYREITEMRQGISETINNHRDIIQIFARTREELDSEDFNLDSADKKRLTRVNRKVIKHFENHIAEFQTLLEDPYEKTQDFVRLRNVRTRLAKITSRLNDLKNPVTTRAGLIRRLNVINQSMKELEQLLDEWSSFTFRDATQGNIVALQNAQEAMGNLIGAIESIDATKAKPLVGTVPGPEGLQHFI